MLVDVKKLGVRKLYFPKFFGSLFVVIIIENLKKNSRVWPNPSDFLTHQGGVVIVQTKQTAFRLQAKV